MDEHKKTVLVILPVRDDQRARLDAAARGCRMLYVPAEQVTETQVREASVIIGCVPPEMIRASDRLELLQLSSAGTDSYIAPGVLAGSTVLCNATGAYGRAVSEHGVALTLTLMKKLYLYRDKQNECLWSDFGTVCSPADATVVVVGLGDIGLQYARTLKAMGSYIIGVKRRPGACPACVDELVLTDDVDTVLPRADVVFAALPGTGGTVHFFTEERFRSMKNTAFFINCGRGSAVESSVLLNALRSGEIAAAAADVAEMEPLPSDHPLWKQRNMVLTPHVSGGYHLPYSFERIVDIACENLEHWAKGEAYRNVIDFETGYKR